MLHHQTQFNHVPIFITPITHNTYKQEFFPFASIQTPLSPKADTPLHKADLHSQLITQNGQ